MPDVSRVRLALPAESADIAEAQRVAWSADQVLSSGLASFDVAEATQVWHGLITRPPIAHCRVLVALDERRLVGFALVGPSDDDDADATDALVHEFVVVPDARRRGHGSRLMHAAVDTMRLDGYVRATWWVATADDVTRAFLIGAGWGPDGAYRELGSDDGIRLRQVRLHTGIADPDSDPHPQEASD